MENIGEDEELNIIKQKSDELVYAKIVFWLNMFVGKDL